MLNYFSPECYFYLFIISYTIPIIHGNLYDKLGIVFTFLVNVHRVMYAIMQWFSNLLYRVPPQLTQEAHLTIVYQQLKKKKPNYYYEIRRLMKRL